MHMTATSCYPFSSELRACSLLIWSKLEAPCDQNHESEYLHIHLSCGTKAKRGPSSSHLGASVDHEEGSMLYRFGTPRFGALAPPRPGFWDTRAGLTIVLFAPSPAPGMPWCAVRLVGRASWSGCTSSQPRLGALWLRPRRLAPDRPSVF